MRGFIGLLLSWSWHVCWHTVTTIQSCEPWGKTITNAWFHRFPFVTKLTRLLAYCNYNTILWTMAGKTAKADKASDRYTENMYSSLYIKFVNMWVRRNDAYVEWLSATNAQVWGFSNCPPTVKERRLSRSANCHKHYEKGKNFQTVGLLSDRIT